MCVLDFYRKGKTPPPVKVVVQMSKVLLESRAITESYAEAKTREEFLRLAGGWWDNHGSGVDDFDEFKAHVLDAPQSVSNR